MVTRFAVCATTYYLAAKRAGMSEDAAGALGVGIAKAIAILKNSRNRPMGERKERRRPKFPTGKPYSPPTPAPADDGKIITYKFDNFHVAYDAEGRALVYLNDPNQFSNPPIAVASAAEFERLYSSVPQQIIARISEYLAGQYKRIYDVYEKVKVEFQIPSAR